MIQLTSSEIDVLIDIIEKNECDCTLHQLIKNKFDENSDDICTIKKLTHCKESVELLECFKKREKILEKLIIKLPTTR